MIVNVIVDEDRRRQVEACFFEARQRLSDAAELLDLEPNISCFVRRDISDAMAAVRHATHSLGLDLRPDVDTP